jgi:hypothetical protein
MSSLKPVIVQNTRENDTCMKASSVTWQLGDLDGQVSSLEKVYWPQTGFTKGDLLGYYRQIAPVAFPRLKDRPVTLRVYPQELIRKPAGRW